MSKSRRAAAPHLRAVAIGFSSGYRWRASASEWGQLIRSTPGMIRVRIGEAHFVVPPHQALWIPAAASHEVVMSGRGTLQRIYVQEARHLPRVARVMALTPLLREVLRRIHRIGTLDRRVPAERHLMDVLLDEFTIEGAQPMLLPMPSDPRARRAAEWMRDGRFVLGPPLAREAGASLRTLERLFQAQTGVSLGAWHQRARIMRALTHLADGMSVTATGLAVGYSSTSAFVVAFRRATGTTPGRYFRAPEV
jgi:AraC-like DNA-binding protein